MFALLARRGVHASCRNQFKTLRDRVVPKAKDLVRSEPIKVPSIRRIETVVPAESAAGGAKGTAGIRAFTMQDGPVLRFHNPGLTIGNKKAEGGVCEVIVERADGSKATIDARGKTAAELLAAVLAIA